MDTLHMWEWISKHIRLWAALVLVGLSANAVHGRSLTVNLYADQGIPREVIGGVLLAGAALLTAVRTPIGFIVGTLPYALYVVSTVYVVLDARGGYATALVYLFSYLQLLALYGRNGGCHADD